MPPHNSPANDTPPMSLHDRFRMSLALPEPEVMKAKLDRLPCSVAFDEAAACLARGDFAGHDAAMRIFRRLERA